MPALDMRIAFGRLLFPSDGEQMRLADKGLHPHRLFLSPRFSGVTMGVWGEIRKQNAFFRFLYFAKLLNRGRLHLFR